MIILGAGLAGCLAAIQNPKATVLEPKETLNTHKAVLRFRSPAVSNATGIPFKKVLVRKSIFDGSSLHSECYIDLANNYSYKVTGKIEARSIWNLAPAERYIAPANFHELMLDMIDNRVVYGPITDPTFMKEPVISTIPMSIMAEYVKEIPCDFGMDFNSIYVTTVNIPCCDIYHTMYFSAPGDPLYRVTLEGSRMIIESMKFIERGVVQEVVDLFGMTKIGFSIVDLNYIQKIGKIPQVDDQARKDFIYQLSTKYGIYSLGRFACWRNILLDDVVKDISKIKSMIGKSGYDLAIGNKEH